jgi:hypothetical protein
LLALTILGRFLMDWLWDDGGGLKPMGRRSAVADNPSGEETRRDMAISAAIVVACVAGTSAVAALVVLLMR